MITDVPVENSTPEKNNLLDHAAELMREELNRLYQGLERADNNTALSHLRLKVFAVREDLDILALAVGNGKFYAAADQALTRTYVTLSCMETGLLSYELNGATIPPDQSRDLFFLKQLFFDEPLPNLMLWIKSCESVNNVLRKFPEHRSEFEPYARTHLQIIVTTNQILQALRIRTIKSADHIINLIEEVKKDPSNAENNQHMHLLAKLCGFALHQFGETDFELWTSGETLNNKQQAQKNFLEEIILNTLKDIFKSLDSPLCSFYSLSIQRLLTDLVEIGIRVFPTLVTELRTYGEPSLQALVVHSPETAPISMELLTKSVFASPENPLSNVTQDGMQARTLLTVQDNSRLSKNAVSHVHSTMFSPKEKERVVLGCEPPPGSILGESGCTIVP